MIAKQRSALRPLIAYGVLSASVAAQVATFRSLGHLPGGSEDSRAFAVSADGSVVVGRSDTAAGNRAFRWTAADGMVELDPLPPGIDSSGASSLSADGTVIIGGTFAGPSSFDPFIWTAESGYLFLGDTGVGFSPYSASGIAADGSVVVGAALTPAGECAYRWTAEFGSVPFQLNSRESGFWGISSDGATCVGSLGGAIAWTEETGIYFLGSFGDNGGAAYSASADGSVIAGETGSDLGIEGFRWKAETGMVGLGDFPGGLYSSAIFDMSADGEILVGFATNATLSEAAIWDRYHGLRSLRGTLTSLFGINLTDWALLRAYGASADGRTIVGSGWNPDRHYEAWIVTMPRPCPADVARNYVVDLADLTRLLGNFGLLSGATHANGDVDLDGDVDLHDLTELLTEFGSVCE